MERTTSRQSLYASRSSLYRRRGRRDSCGESVISYRDDMNIGRRSYSQDYDDEDDFDGYEKPLSRREREKLSRSLGELQKRTSERSTQTLRETATQTGQEVSVIMQPKRVVKKKKRSRSLSSSGTQTTKEIKKQKKEEAAAAETKGRNSPPSGANVEKPPIKPKPKPKPKPRKSTVETESIATTQAEDSEDGKKKKRKKKKSQSAISQFDGVAESDPSQNLPPGAGVNPQQVPYPQPGYQGQGAYPGQVPVTMQVQYPGQPQVVGQAGPHIATLPYNTQISQGFVVQPHVTQTHRPPVPAQGHPQGPPQSHQHGPPQGPPRPSQSNWDALCAITNTDYQKQQALMSETGSLTSSVFTSHLPSHPGSFAVPLHPGPPGQPYTNFAYTGSPPQGGSPAPQSNIPQGATLTRIPPPYAEALTMSGASAPPPLMTMPQYNLSGSHSPHSGSDSGLGVVHSDRTNLIQPAPKKSSWEVLQQMADQQNHLTQASVEIPRQSESAV